MDNLEIEDFESFCKAYGVEFFRIGCPKDWNDKSVFRVATIEYPQRGITVPVSKVCEWKQFQPNYVGDGI